MRESFSPNCSAVASSTDANGNNRKKTEIICEKLQLGPKPSSSIKEITSEKIDSENPISEELPEIELDEQEKEIKEEDLPF